MYNSQHQTFFFKTQSNETLVWTTLTRELPKDYHSIEDFTIFSSASRVLWHAATSLMMKHHAMIFVGATFPGHFIRMDLCIFTRFIKIYTTVRQNVFLSVHFYNTFDDFYLFFSAINVRFGIFHNRTSTGVLTVRQQCVSWRRCDELDVLTHSSKPQALL